MPQDQVDFRRLEGREYPHLERPDGYPDDYRVNELLAQVEPSEG
jgi:hypothetical protein